MRVACRITKERIQTHTHTRIKLNPLNAKLNLICHLLALLAAHHILHVSRISFNTYCFLRQQWLRDWTSLLYQVTYLLIYLLTPWCRVLPEQLPSLQLVKKFPAFHGTRRFITALTRVRQLSLSWASPIQSIYPHRTSWRSILILSTHLRLGLPSGLLPSGFCFIIF